MCFLSDDLFLLVKILGPDEHAVKSDNYFRNIREPMTSKLPSKFRVIILVVNFLDRTILIKSSLAGNSEVRHQTKRINRYRKQ